MINPQILLDQFLGAGSARSQGSQDPSLSGRASTGETLQDGLGQIFGGGSGRSGGSGGLGDLVGSVLGGGSGGRGGFGGQALGGALAGGLASYVLRSRSKRPPLGGSALRLGGLALIAGLGYKAWQNYQAQQRAQGNSAAGASAQPGGTAAPAGWSVPDATLPARPVPADEIPSAQGTAFHPDGAEADDRALLILSAMIAAAKADGTIDQAEQEAIFGRVDTLDLDNEAKGMLMDEMRKPLSIDEIAARVKNPETAVEVYMASVLAIDPDQPEEKAYLERLASRLNLPAELTSEVHRTAGEATN